ncbi:unannotated protein [freshwater metagenome]|uniref:Unannotated protein n=1 Tax=freshwater metagenome TaxID=449393 RepID=A0A6J6YA04_9ZZZZ
MWKPEELNIEGTSYVDNRILVKVLIENVARLAHMHPVVVIDGIETNKAMNNSLHAVESQHLPNWRGVWIDVREQSTTLRLRPHHVSNPREFKLCDRCAVDLLWHYRLKLNKASRHKLGHLLRG